MPKKLKSEFKESYDVFAKCEAFYTGGKVQFTKSGLHILSLCQEKLKIFEINGGSTCDAVENFDGEDISSFLLAENDETLVTAAKNGVMRHWYLPTKRLEKTWKSLHMGPISCMALDSTSTLLATGGSDSTVKVWDIVRKYYTHNLKGGQGVFSKVCFLNIGSQLHIVGAADDYKIHIWNLHTSKCVASLSGHYSTVTDIVFPGGDNLMLSCGRDKVVLLWNILDHKLLKTIPVFETVEACMLVPKELSLSNVNFNPEDSYFITAGDKGKLRVWSVELGTCIYEPPDTVVQVPEDSTYEGPLVMQAVYVPALKAFGVVSFEHNVVLCSVEDFAVKNQFVGYNDDILSVKFLGKADDHIAVATNSSQIKIFQLPSFSCQLLKGHNDIVLCLDTFPKHRQLLVSGSKDNNIKVWDIDAFSVISVYTGYGHTDSVTAVCCCRGKSRFFASGSEDTTLKLWEVPEKQPLVAVKLLLAPYCTVKAHDKHINSIDISENDKLLVSGSQDHAAKLWDTTDLSLIGTFKGHKKGIWCVKFSPVDLALATSSGDETIRIWSIVDFSCLKVFQGHEASVLQVQFLSRGMQLVSSASDGNIKLWDIKNNLCIKTLSDHELKVWSLAASLSEDYIVSGGADSNIIVWKDTTKLQKTQSLEETEKYIVQEQELKNLVLEKKWTKALKLAIHLDKPYQVYNIIEEILLQQSGEKILQNICSTLRHDQIESLMKFSEEWATNTRTSYPAILIINYIYQSFDTDELHKLPNITTFVRNILPYLDRHFKRLNRRCQDVQILNFLCNQYQLGNTIGSNSTSLKRVHSNPEITEQDKRICTESSQL